MRKEKRDCRQHTHMHISSQELIFGSALAITTIWAIWRVETNSVRKKKSKHKKSTEQTAKQTASLCFPMLHPSSPSPHTNIIPECAEVSTISLFCSFTHSHNSDKTMLYYSFSSLCILSSSHSFCLWIHRLTDDDRDRERVTECFVAIVITKWLIVRLA